MFTFYHRSVILAKQFCDKDKINLDRHQATLYFKGKQTTAKRQGKLRMGAYLINSTEVWT